MSEESNNRGYCLFGLEALRQRAPVVAQHSAGVRAAEDIEAVHQMRVATRRLRAAFALFADCLPGRDARRWQKDIRRITRALGAARDTDVQFEWLKGFLTATTDPALLPGINRLLLRLHQQRQRQQADVIKALDRLEADRTIDELNEALRAAVVQARLEQIEARAPEVYDRAAEAIALRLEEFLAYDVFVHQPERVAELHAMRIAAKRLRYTLEIFAELYTDELKKPIKAVKEIQELLGGLHDCDVWIDFVPRFAAEEHARTFEYFGTDTVMPRLWPGLAALRADRQRARRQFYRDFVKFWERAQTDELWAQLRQAITRPENRVTHQPPASSSSA